LSGLKEVARRSGVSPATVSRVINEPERVRAETRARVEAAIRELRYRPSRVARRLRVARGSSRLVGLVLPDVQNPFFADLARGVEDAAQGEGYTVILGNSDEDEAKQGHYLEVMRAELVDGFILPPLSDRDAAVAELVRTGIPEVCVDRRLAKPPVDLVVLDNVRGAHDATEHLLEAGHRRIGFLVGRPRVSTSRERLEGYRRALEEWEVEADASLVQPGGVRSEGGAAAAAALLDLAEPPSALLAGNSALALGALEEIRRRGLRIPGEVAMVGFDDAPWAPVTSPPLTAVRQPAYEMGRRAMELLLRRFREPRGSTTTVMLQPELIVRGSSGPAGS
jgi:LacI family transcriptional regulator/LacI family repressor for deo operon, udp, cdd, tsx, nupC, and nupG